VRKGMGWGLITCVLCLIESVSQSGTVFVQLQSPASPGGSYLVDCAAFLLR
jgi:hypothetical protein